MKKIKSKRKSKLFGVEITQRGLLTHDDEAVILDRAGADEIAALLVNAGVEAKVVAVEDET